MVKIYRSRSSFLWNLLKMSSFSSISEDIPKFHFLIWEQFLFIYLHFLFFNLDFLNHLRRSVYMKKLSRLCLDAALNKQDSTLLEQDNNVLASYKCNNNSWQLLDNSVHYPIPALIQAASNSRTKCGPLNVSDQFYFLWISKVWGIFLQGRVGGKFRIKIATFYFYKLFWHLFVVFHYKMCVDHLHIF